MTPDEAIETLAERMYFRLQKADPDHDEPVPWDRMRDCDKEIYRNVVRDLSRYPECWKTLAEADA